eukprot:TRINITY_DN4586_c0_g1_i1.p1 TRINITY_DN4586_c0_g1~~TRINITY_DN4586_c0_g1_i1.p1  ORF type:complete len:405 (-),score=67.47 TRINITY_DN4586_c0_g1_i1:4-1071(-)
MNELNASGFWRDNSLAMIKSEKIVADPVSDSGSWGNGQYASRAPLSQEPSKPFSFPAAAATLTTDPSQPNRLPLSGTVASPKAIMAKVRDSILTYDQKKEIAQNLVKLPEIGLSSVLDIIKKCEPNNLQMEGGGEWQFDMGELSSSTVWKIKVFIDSWFAQVQPAEMMGQVSHPFVNVGPLNPTQNSRGVTLNINVDELRKSLELRKDTLLSCPHCNKKFETSALLVKHVKTHSPDKPYACEVCGKAFRHQSTRKDHANTHLKIKPYLCEFKDCGKRFANMANLKRHFRTHTNEKPFACMHCGRLFNQSSNCKQHEVKCGGNTTKIKKRVPVAKKRAGANDQDSNPRPAKRTKKK